MTIGDKHVDMTVRLITVKRPHPGYSLWTRRPMENDKGPETAKPVTPTVKDRLKSLLMRSVVQKYIVGEYDEML